MTNEEEGRAGATAAPDTAGDATGATTATAGDTGTATAADIGKATTVDTDTATAADAGKATAVDTETATAVDAGTATEPVALATPDPPAPATEALDTMPPPSPPPDGARVRNSLEAVKTAVVWLVVIQILTILSPLLPVSLKWAIIVGLLLSVSSFAVGALAYLKAGRAQQHFPE